MSRQRPSNRFTMTITAANTVSRASVCAFRLGLHQGEDQPDLDHRHRKREDQRAERLADAVRDHLGMVDRRDDRAHQDDATSHALSGIARLASAATKPRIGKSSLARRDRRSWAVIGLLLQPGSASATRPSLATARFNPASRRRPGSHPRTISHRRNAGLRRGDDRIRVS